MKFSFTRAECSPKRTIKCLWDVGSRATSSAKWWYMYSSNENEKPEMRACDARAMVQRRASVWRSSAKKTTKSIMIHAKNNLQVRETVNTVKKRDMICTLQRRVMDVRYEQTVMDTLQNDGRG